MEKSDTEQRATEMQQKQHWPLIQTKHTWEILSNTCLPPWAILSLISGLWKVEWKPIGFIRLESTTRRPGAPSLSFYPDTQLWSRKVCRKKKGLLEDCKIDWKLLTGFLWMEGSRDSLNASVFKIKPTKVQCLTL